MDSMELGMTNEEELMLHNDYIDATKRQPYSMINGNVVWENDYVKWLEDMCISMEVELNRLENKS